MEFGDVVDQLHDDDGLADACATERADFAALQERADQIDDLDAGGEHLRARWIDRPSGGAGAMNGITFVGLDRALLVHRLAGDIEHAAHDAFADRHGDRRAGIR